jgi:peptidoglycan/LPS O-acetylase OafA/YrhL
MDLSRPPQEGDNQISVHSDRKHQYRPEIDGLRAFAVIAVILNHIDTRILPSGYLGVDIFFVISGFVITASLVSTSHVSLRSLLARFYARRARRLLPALLVFILVISLLICLVNPAPADTLLTGMSALFGGSNLFLMQRSADYFAPSTQLNAFTHTWSLGVEEQFYFLYPLLFWFARAKHVRWRSWFWLVLPVLAAMVAVVASKFLTGSYVSMIPGGFYALSPYLPYLLLLFSLPLLALLKPFACQDKNLILCLALLSCLSLLSFCFQYDHRFAAAYFLMPSRFWELAAGCLVFLLINQSKSRQPFPGWVGLATLVLITIILCLPQAMGKLATLLIVPLSALGLASFADSKSVNHGLTQPLLLSIGRFSYSLYLWHWGILCLGRWTIGLHWWSVPLLLALTVLASIASYRWLEQPCRNAAWLRLKRRTFWLSAASLAGSLLAMQGLRSNAEALSLDHRFAGDAVDRRDQERRQFLETANRISNRFDPEALVKQLTIDGQGAPLPRPRLYVFGDSHSEHYVDSLRWALPEYGVSLGSTGWRCGYISPLDIGPLTKQWMDGCERYKQTVDMFLRDQLRPGDFVLVAHRWLEKKDAKHQEDVLDHLASLVASRGGQAIAIDDVPELGVDDSLLCEKRPWRPFPLAGCTRSRHDVDLDQAPLDRMMEALERRHPAFHYVKLRDLYCQGSVCGPYRGGLFLYKDNNHLSPQASRLGAARLASVIRGIASADRPPVQR